MVKTQIENQYLRWFARLNLGTKCKPTKKVQFLLSCQKIQVVHQIQKLNFTERSVRSTHFLAKLQYFANVQKLRRSEIFEVLLTFYLELCLFRSTAQKMSQQANREPKADQRPYRRFAANHVGAAVLAHVARSGRLDAAHR